MTGIRFPVGTRTLSLLRNIQKGSAGHPAPYPTGTESFFLEVRLQEREAYHSPPSDVKVNNSEYTFTLP
jgi:hypothetical protein